MDILEKIRAHLTDSNNKYYRDVIIEEDTWLNPIRYFFRSLLLIIILAIAVPIVIVVAIIYLVVEAISAIKKLIFKIPCEE